MAKSNLAKTLVVSIERSILLSKVMGKTDLLSIHLFEKLLRRFRKHQEHHGAKFALIVWKYWYNCLTRRAMQETNTEKPPIWERNDRDSIPRILFPLKRLIDLNKKDVLSQRLVLTAMRSFESCEIEPVPSFKTILADSDGTKNYTSNLRQEFSKFLNKSSFADFIKRTFEIELEKLKSKEPRIPFHYSTKMGICGPTIATATLQSLALNDDMIINLSSLSSIFFKEDLRKIIRSNQEQANQTCDLVKPRSNDKSLNYLGRISFVPDKGPKTRVVAIGNYWIQNTLKPLHQVMFKTLRKIAADGTYDQISQSSRVSRATEIGPVWSYDLTAATDRIPLLPQIDAMKYLHNEIGCLWENIFTNIVFYYKGKDIKYKVGQPMGLYTSWASLAVIHHLLIQFCAYKEDLKGTFLDYAVLGDDVAIWNRNVARRYEQVMELLCVEISKSKSYLPGPKGPYKAEFAKRIYYNGVELSAISPGVLRQGFKSFWALPELFTFLIRHGLPEVGSTPISRVVKLLRLTPKKVQQLVCAIKVNELLGGPQLNVDLSINSELEVAIQSFDVLQLLQERIDLLSESALDLYSFDEEEDRASLENTLGGPVDENIAIMRIFESRKKEVFELSDRMLTYIPGLEDWDDPIKFINKNKASDEHEYEDNIVTKLKEVEYIPNVTINGLIDEVIHSKDKKEYRVEYLKTLVSTHFGVILKQMNV